MAQATGEATTSPDAGPMILCPEVAILLGAYRDDRITMGQLHRGVDWLALHPAP